MNTLEKLELFINEKASKEEVKLEEISTAVDKALEYVLGPNYSNYRYLLLPGLAAVRDAVVETRKSEIIRKLISLS